MHFIFQVPGHRLFRNTDPAVFRRRLVIELKRQDGVARERLSKKLVLTPGYDRSTVDGVPDVHLAERGRREVVRRDSRLTELTIRKFDLLRSISGLRSEFA